MIDVRWIETVGRGKGGRSGADWDEHGGLIIYRGGSAESCSCFGGGRLPRTNNIRQTDGQKGGRKLSQSYYTGLSSRACGNVEGRCSRAQSGGLFRASLHHHVRRHFPTSELTGFCYSEGNGVTHRVGLGLVP